MPIKHLAYYLTIVHATCMLEVGGRSGGIYSQEACSQWTQQNSWHMNAPSTLAMLQFTPFPVVD